MTTSEPGYVNRTYRLAPDVAARVKTLANEHGLYDSSLVSFLLQHALDQVDAGRLVIHKRPVAFVIDDGGGKMPSPA
jgi:hypothetical protein